MFDGRALANAILDTAEEHGIPMTNMAVLKTIYFCHGWSLAGVAELLCSSTFEAWEYGPVVPVVYHQFRRFGATPIKDRCQRICLETGSDLPFSYSLTASQSEQLHRFVEFYGSKPALHLSDMTHEPGGAWDLVWSGANARPGMRISNEVIKADFLSRLEHRRYQ